MTDITPPESYPTDGVWTSDQLATVDALPLPDNVIASDPLPVPIIPHIHDYEEVCTTACPASPFNQPKPAPMVEPLNADYVIDLGLKIDALTAQQEAIAGMLAVLMEQVQPTLDQISNNPMFKMMFGGK